MLETVDLSCIRGERTLFARLAFAAVEGTCVQVAGANGSGKTSLLRVLSGQVAPAAGAVRWNGEDVRDLRESYRASLAYVGHLNGVKDELTALENIRLAASLAGAPAGVDPALRALARLGLAGRGDLPARKLSQGQKRRVALARLCLAPAARLWILDEPFNALDAAGVAAVAALIGEHASGGGIVVLTTHLEVELPARRLRIDLDAAER